MITTEHKEQLEDIIARAEQNPDLLSKFESDFIIDFAERLSTYGEHVMVSSKQQGVFDKILLKLEKHDV